MNKKFKDNIKVLVYGDLSKLENTMDQHFFRQLHVVSDDMTQEPKTIDKLNDYVQDGKYTHLMIPDEHFHMLDGNFVGCKVPVIELLGDHWIPWAIDKKKEYIKENGIKDAIVLTGRFLEPYNKMANFHPVFYGYDSEIFTDNGKERDIDILISGFSPKGEYVWEYPVRNWLSDIVPEIGIKEGLKVEVKNHPGYFPEQKPDGGYQKEYSNILNRSKIATGGSSHWGLPLKKFYEGPACGAILLSDLPLDDTVFFKDRIIEIDPKRINSAVYEDVVRRKIVNTLADYDNSKERLQPFRTEQDRFARSYKGRALEMRAVLSHIK